ncbi:MAG: arsenic efflux protein [Eubacterium sp.]|nr:arsenic efflux protein [Eubacterium sp.]
MLDFFVDIFIEAGTDTLKLVPFLFLTYVLMEWLEHRTGSRTQAAIRRAGKAGPLLGGVIGVFPQCGFSAAASNLYSGGLITAGTLVAVFLSTSDEMLPIFISEAVPAGTILRILATKVVIGVICGFALDFLYHGILRRQIRYRNIHTMCESEHCKCEEGIFPSALRHTLQITVFIFLITLLLEAVLEGLGEEALSGLLLDQPVIGELIAGLIGLVPNCASSVVITQLYLEQVIGAGPMMAGLLINAGVGILVLCRMNRRRVKQNLGIISYVYLAGVAWGILIDLLHITF